MEEAVTEERRTLLHTYLDARSQCEERDLVFTYKIAGMLYMEQHADNKACRSCKPNNLGATTLAATSLVRLVGTHAHVTEARSGTAY